jgi:squalene synthase HpnC
MAFLTATPDFTADFEQYGPFAVRRERPSIEQSRAYCRRLARTHYENFTVASWLLPRNLRQHFANVYAYCRWADDLADETDDPRRRLELLDWWQGQLERCFRGNTWHPVFTALAETVQLFAIPPDPFHNLLIAFRRDQRQTRYGTFVELLDYCRYSANPVGRLVLFLGGCHRDSTVALSDSICTGLQLANFCQDVGQDYRRGRIYVPLEDIARHDCEASFFERGEPIGPLRDLMASQVDRAALFLVRGYPLTGLVPRWLRADVGLFIEGGRAVLEKIRRANYDVWTRRVTVGKCTRARLLFHAWLGTARIVRQTAAYPHNG